MLAFIVGNFALRHCRFVVCGLSLCVFTAGCRPSDKEQRTPSEELTTEDAEIVVNTSAEIAGLPEWRIDTLSPVQILNNGDDTFIDITTLVKSGNGRIFVSDNGSRQVRRYSLKGRFEKVVARSGQGPGEVGAVDVMNTLPGDRLIIFDASQRRATILDSSGNFVDQINYPTFRSAERMRIISAVDSTHWVVSIRNGSQPVPEGDEIRRRKFAIVSIAWKRMPDSASRKWTPTFDTVAIVPDIQEFQARVVANGATMSVMHDLRFGEHSVATVSDSSIIIGTNERNELSEYLDKKRVRVVRIDRRAKVVTERDRLASVDQLMALYKKMKMPPAQTREFEEQVESFRYAKAFPYYQRLIAGTDGTLWVEEPNATENDAKQLTVFEKGGKAVARVRLPPGYRPIICSKDQIIGTLPDADGVPTIRMWNVRHQPMN